MRTPQFLNTDLSFIIVIAAFLLVGLFNAIKLGYIKKKNIPIIILIIIVLLITGFLLR